MTEDMTKKELYSMADVSEMLNVQYYKIQYVIRAGKILKPQEVMGRAAFTESDIKKLCTHFGKPVPALFRNHQQEGKKDARDN